MSHTAYCAAVYFFKIAFFLFFLSHIVLHFSLQVWEGRGRMCLGTLYARRLLSQLCEPFRVRVWLELLWHLLPDGRQRLLPVHLPGPVAEPLPAGVLPGDPFWRRAGDRMGLPGQRLGPASPATGPEKSTNSALQRQPVFGMCYESAYCKGESTNGCYY